MPKNINDGAYVINLDEYSDIRNHSINLYISNNDAIYFDSFGVKYIPKEIKHFIRNRNMQTNIRRIQTVIQ